MGPSFRRSTAQHTMDGARGGGRVKFSWQSSETIAYFDTFDAREAAFNQAVGHLLPVRYKGANAFWRDFSRIAQKASDAQPHPCTFITSNPRDGLAFGSPRQVLAAAQATARGRAPISRLSDEIERIARQFGLEPTLEQPIRTLSGGETVRLALAKAMIASAACARLVIASPFCWMAAPHMPLLDRVVEAYGRTGKAVTILAMTDEADQNPMTRRWRDQVDLRPVKFTLTCSGCRIALGTPINAITTQPSLARVEDGRFELHSPCLVVGDNGQGKSLLAKALCGAMVLEGQAEIGSEKGQGRARLLFQDVITQTLMRSNPEIARGHGLHPSTSGESLFTRIGALYRKFRADGRASADTFAPDALRDEMPDIKAALIAARLAERPAAIILDEPDWGLTRSCAIALVLAVVQTAHDLGIPAILISHKPWWRPLAASCLVVSRGAPARGPVRFSIQITQDGPLP